MRGEHYRYGKVFCLVSSGDETVEPLLDFWQMAVSSYFICMNGLMGFWEMKA